MRRREFVAALTFIAAWCGAHAQQPGRRYQVGILSPEAPPPGMLEVLERGLHEVGYVRGQNIVFETRNAGGDRSRLTALARELVNLRVDVILAVNTPAAQAAKEVTATIPIVMTRVADPVKTGLVSSLSRPGGNITGVTTSPDEFSGKRLQLLKETLPGVTRVAVLWWANPGGDVVVHEMEAPARRLGLELLRLPVNGPDEIPKAFEGADSERAEAIVLVDDALITQHRSAITDLAAKRRLPVFAVFKPFAESGALMAYGPSTPALYRRVADYIARILNGANPGELPVERPTVLELVLNRKVRTRLGWNYRLLSSPAPTR